MDEEAQGRTASGIWDRAEQGAAGLVTRGIDHAADRVEDARAAGRRGADFVDDRVQEARAVGQVGRNIAGAGVREAQGGVSRGVHTAERAAGWGVNRGVRAAADVYDWIAD
jgi:hypothetical protein